MVWLGWTGCCSVCRPELYFYILWLMLILSVLSTTTKNYQAEAMTWGLNIGILFLFYLFIYLFFYFTILYWFCHTSTWILHGRTCVPHPETPNHLPPHTIPPGHPSAPAPRILYQTWTGDSFLIWYDTCFHAILPNHPTLSLSHRVQKTVLYICVSFAVSHTGLSLPSF